MKIFKNILSSFSFVIFVLLCNNAIAQDNESIKLFDSFEGLNDSVGIISGSESINSKYLIGSLKYELEDGSTITPSGLEVTIYKANGSKEETVFTKATTTGKGTFYFQGMEIGKYKITIENRGSEICIRYFAVQNIAENKLETMLIPMNKVDETMQTKQMYDDF